MDEKVDGSGQEEQNADNPDVPAASVVEQTELCHHQDASTLNQNLPIMHWEDLSLRIAELEKQEKEKRQKVWKQTVSSHTKRTTIAHDAQYAYLEFSAVISLTPRSLILLLTDPRIITSNVTEC